MKTTFVKFKPTTELVDFKESNTPIDIIRKMSYDEFIEKHGSGTLRKNNRIGLDVTDQYWHERIAYEFGYEFEMLPSSYVLVDQAQSFPDCKASTEFGWHTERYKNTRVYPEDTIYPAFATITNKNGEIIKQGNAIIVKTTSLDIPIDHVVFAIIHEYDAEKGWSEVCFNPF